MASLDNGKPKNSKTLSPTGQPSGSHSSRRMARPVSILVTFIVITLAVFFGIQLVQGTGVFTQPGTIVFNDSTTELNRNFVTANTSAIDLESDVTISARTTSTKLPDTPENVLYNILVPTTNFNNSAISISAAEAAALSNSSTNAGDALINLTSIWDLAPSQKLLAIDDNYYLDTLDSGAFFEYLILEGENTNDIAQVSQALTQNIEAFPNHDTILTLAQTGVTALSRRMNSYLNSINSDAGYFAAKIAPFLSQFDFTHTSNESSFSSAANGNNICSAPVMINALTAIGLDIVELTGNHNQDCGDEAALQTLQQYQELGIQTVGGGATAAAAAVPLRLSERGTNLTLLAYNLSTGGYTLDDTPGANFYTEEKVKSDIAAAKERGDFIIIDIQYYECNEYADSAENTICDYADSAAGDQIGFFRQLIDFGADIVVGTSAHQPQTYELYHDGAIYYGLGNLFFDQSMWPGTTRSLVLVHYFYDNQLVQTRIVPTVYDDTFQTELMATATAEQFLARLIQAQPTQP